MATGCPKSTRARRFAAGGTTTSWPPSSSARCATAPSAAAPPGATSWRRPRRACARLGVDYIDLYQIHFWDHATPIEETLRALEDLVRAGYVRYIGCSNFAAWQIVEAQWVARTQHLSPFISVQCAYNLLDRAVEVDLVPVCQR